MTYLRHAARHVHYTVAEYVESQLAGLGWTVAGSTPFGVNPITVKRSAGPAADVETGQVRISMGSEFMPDEEEMGGPLSSQDYPIFFDIFMDSEGLALALASDVRDILLGRIGGKRVLRLVDQSTSTEVPDWRIELDDIERVRPDHTLPMAWQVVKVTAVAYFPEVVY